MRAADRIKEPPEAMKRMVKEKNIEIMVHPMYSAEGELMDTDIPMKDESFMLSL